MERTMNCSLRFRSGAAAVDRRLARAISGSSSPVSGSCPRKDWKDQRLPVGSFSRTGLNSSNEGRRGRVRRVKLFKTSVINSFQVLPWRVNRLPTFWSPFPSMKSFFFASALMVLAHPAPADVFAEIDTPNPLIGIASVEESPLVLVGFAPDSGAQETDSELQDLRQDLREAEARLQETRRTAEAVVEERDEAREEVGALTMANHRMLMEIRMLQKEKEQARQEAVVWKARAEESMKQASALDEAGVEMIGLKEEFHALRQDLVRVREELKDPIERVSLREQLVAARAHGERLEKEIAAALKSGEEARRVASREREDGQDHGSELCGKFGPLGTICDFKAGHLKALVDVELLKKTSDVPQRRKSSQLCDRLSAVSRPCRSKRPQWRNPVCRFNVIGMRPGESTVEADCEDAFERSNRELPWLD